MRLIRNSIIFFFIAALAGAADNTGWWRLYFTSPGNKGHQHVRKNPRSGLISVINQSKKFFYGAFYDISEPEIVASLIKARERGVAVKLVTEADTAGRRKRVQGRWTDAGIEVTYNDRRGLMHNKFAVADGEWVWTGSYNPTVNDTEKNNNNAILIRSAEAAGIFEREFMEMFRDKIFGNRREAGPFSGIWNNYYVKIGDTDINVYFSPEDNIERIIVKRLAKAESSIHFMAFSFTSDPIGEMMIKKSKEGVRVYGLFERKGSKNSHSEYMKMKLEGLPVKLDHNRNLMHHKVIIIDAYRVITGSYNFSRNAQNYNDENILIIDNREIAAEYLAEFNRLYK
jgi:phosphatidylserine/phosphatidylglycerophosphate/cardiolipin synthase-like enzyme